MTDSQPKSIRKKITKKITMSNPTSETVEESDMTLDASEDIAIGYTMGSDNPIQVDDSDEAVTLKLPGSLDMVVAGYLKEALLYARSLNKKVVLDGSDVEQLSTPAIQLILAAQIELSMAGLEAILLRPSEEFASAFDDLGLFSALMKWKVES